MKVSLNVPQRIAITLSGVAFLLWGFMVLRASLAIPSHQPSASALTFAVGFGIMGVGTALLNLAIKAKFQKSDSE